MGGRQTEGCACACTTQGLNRRTEAIIPVIKERMHNTREQELATGLSEMMKIAHDRLRKLKAEQKL